jgi:hypothetical protein
MKYIVNAIELAYLQDKVIEAETRDEAIRKYLDLNLEGEVMVNRTDIIDFSVKIWEGETCQRTIKN